MMGCVLVALCDGDSTGDADRAVEVARNLARFRDADVRVIHVVEDPEDSGDFASSVHGQSVFDAVADAMRRRGRVRRSVTLTDDVRAFVDEQLERFHPLALVLVRDRLRWRDGWFHPDLTGTAEHVARDFGIPVVVIEKD